MNGFTFEAKCPDRRLYEDNNIRVQNVDKTTSKIHRPITIDRSAEPPSAFDWGTKYGAVSGVKQQGDYDTQWAFAVVGQYETFHMIETGDLIQFSPQFLLDCFGQFTSIMRVLEFVQANGMRLESQYPYKGDSGECRDSGLIRILIAFDIVHLSKSGTASAIEYETMKTLYYYGAVIVLLFNNDFMGFSRYKSGVFYVQNCHCMPEIGKRKDPDIVLLVGYGVDNRDGAYWNAKNSWGIHFGDKGYIKIARNKNFCGITLGVFAIKLKRTITNRR